MVADDPFHEPRPPARAHIPSPILRVTSEGDLPATASGSYVTPEDLPTAPPAAFTGPGTGTRTPRRVQWTQDHIVNLPPLEAADTRESQLSDTNINEVNDALERFRSHRYRPSNLSTASVASLASSDASDHHHHHHHHPLRNMMHRYPPQQAEDDYDYRLDHHSDEERRDVFDNGLNDHTAQYIPPGETDGLPSLPSQPEKSENRAETLVRAHTSKWSTLRRRVHRGSVRRQTERPTSGRDEYDRVENERPRRDSEKRRSSESTAVDAPLNPPINPPINPPLGGMPHMPGGTSVLSSLLALYGRHQHDSAAPSLTTSASNTPVPSDDEGDKFGRRSHDDANRSSTSIADRRSPLPSPGLKNKFQRAAHTWRQGDRPKAARSDAGVFGALIGATGGLAASAAPNSTTLVPAAKRTGYHLTRYSLPGTPQEFLSPPRSPRSRPASMVSGVSEMGERDDASSKSTDDLVMMKKRGKPSSSLNLQALRKEGGAALHSAQKWISAGTPLTDEERKRKEWEAEKRRRKKAKERRKKQEVFIIQHVAAILARQQFLLKLARALMMFGSPSHRLETQIQATARVLEINAQVVYLPGTMLVSFGDDATHTSETKFLKQSTGLDLGKLLAVHNVYWNVVHDRCSVDDASRDLDGLMTSKPLYSRWQTVVISMMCSAFIVVPAFYGSFIDALMCAVLGGLLAVVQMLAVMNDMFSNVFEIVIATLISFIAAVLSDTNKFCYTALVSGGVVLILPGFIVLTGALELASRNITAGSVRIGYAVIYSLFLGFGISMGGEIYFKIRHRGVKNAADYTCAATHVPGAPWYMAEPSGYWYYLCVPMYSLCLSLRNGQPILRKETLVMMAVGSAGWSANHFTGPVFRNRSDITSAIGSFCVGIIGNLYGRFFSNGASFPVMVTGILMQLPSGLSQGGLFSFAAEGQKISESNGTSGTTTTQYSQGFQVAEQLVSVAIGLTVGLFVAAVVTHPLGGGRRRGAGIFSF
ncbi:DUF1212-domain-containing protein [Cutaneotrichosporon oleaginosum]|uniref:DUF1212-domain-containing protein n=1 Tax=Cutaneotrichosporon oleaginosum TaxID=879819 RepID=A0A0J0XVA9_9TREE|nr:DUF1212-domain-containing protein [Cutaneotrichosporon oleaginosum]KLT44991.1 DUF1212-domain-containing protein [Cutaneotrichosporon oleaginosum]